MPTLLDSIADPKELAASSESTLRARLAALDLRWMLALLRSSQSPFHCLLTADPNFMHALNLLRVCRVCWSSGREPKHEEIGDLIETQLVHDEEGLAQTHYAKILLNTRLLD